MNKVRLALASLCLISLFPQLACSGSDGKSGAPADPEIVEPAAGDARFLLSLETSKLPVLQGDSARVRVTVERKDGFEGPVDVSAEGLPPGVTAKPLTIAADETSAELELSAKASAPHSLPISVEIRGQAEKLEDSRELTVTVYGPPGSVDTSFQGGKVTVPVGGTDAYAYAMAAQRDGKLLVAGTSHDHAGDFTVLRFTRDGELDTSFGSAGIVTTQVGDGADVARAIAVDDKGRVVVAGSASGATSLDFAVVRYLADGKLDTSFGDDGKTIVSFGDDADTAYALVLQSDGKIVIGGDSSRGSSQSGVDFALLRLDADGKPDTSFGDAGLVTSSIAKLSARDSIYALALQTISGEERIVAAGGEGDFMLARFHADGALDETFGEQGKVTGLFGSTIGAARALSITPEGEVVVAGHAQHDFALAKLRKSGSLDPAFGVDGKVLTAVSKDNWDEAQGLALAADGKLLVAGWTYEGNSSSGNTALLRYDADGALDSSFGEAGIVITQVAAANKPDQGSALLISPDERVPSERILVAGNASASYSQFAVTRFWR
ncbi:MAG TPA: hypothetical protein VER96_23720 [Polyangiaceae bacterium]|nr:hypothetical protein [Polyangiaceae bacterium]